MTIEEILKPLDGYLYQIKRNTDFGTYELEVGIHSDWVYKSTNKIQCEIIHEAKNGILLAIKPLDEDITVDNLINFVKILVETNQRILKMQEEFDKKMEKIKEQLIEDQKHFYDELEEVKESSFQIIEKENEKLNLKVNSDVQKQQKELKDKFKKEKKEAQNKLQEELEDKLS
ncbi:MAG: hypothetical protein ACOCVF_01540 [bacterium]